MIDLINDILARMGSQAFEFAPRVLVSILIFLIFSVVAWAIRAVVKKVGRKMETDRSKAINLIGSVLVTLVIAIGLITAMGTLGMDVSALVAGLGLTGFALGFAFKDALSNFLAGILILFYHPYRCGDRIKVSGCEGVVTGIDLRYTHLEDSETEFLIPNSSCFTNWIAVKRIP